MSGKGGPTAAGNIFNCPDCGIEVIRTGNKHFRCSDCSRAARLAVKREKARKRYSESESLRKKFAEDNRRNKGYPISNEDYENRLKTQAYCCMICDRHSDSLKRSLAVDHDHDTGHIRGLLCSNCNTMLGLVRDSTEILKQAIKYLENNRKGNDYEM